MVQAQTFLVEISKSNTLKHPSIPNHIHPKVSTPKTMNTWQLWQVWTQWKKKIAKDSTWKAVRASNIVYKPNLKVEEEERKRM